MTVQSEGEASKAIDRITDDPCDNQRQMRILGAGALLLMAMWLMGVAGTRMMSGASALEVICALAAAGCAGVEAAIRFLAAGADKDAPRITLAIRLVGLTALVIALSLGLVQVAASGGRGW